MRSITRVLGIICIIVAMFLSVNLFNNSTLAAKDTDCNVMENMPNFSMWNPVIPPYAQSHKVVRTINIGSPLLPKLTIWNPIIPASIPSFALWNPVIPPRINKTTKINQVVSPVIPKLATWNPLCPPGIPKLAQWNPLCPPGIPKLDQGEIIVHKKLA